jgi:mannose-1-phosphate guanylyltransferase
MKVCIMCGGVGTRLRPLTFERPKPCIPIVNTPSLSHLVSHLSHLGFTDVIITLGYMGDAIMEALGDGSLFGVNITYVHEKTKLGTAGSVKNAQEYLDESPFLVVGGDHVTDIDLLSFYREHLRGRGMVSIALVSIDDPGEYGIAEIDSGYDIKRFMEKPSPGKIFSNLASTGMYVCNPAIFDYIPEGEQFDFAKNLFPLLMEKGHILKGWLARGHWTDVGSPKALRKAERWKLQCIPHTRIQGDVIVKGAKIIGPVHLGGSISIGNASRVIGPVSIGAGTVIGENVLIGPYTSIGEGCRISDGTKIFSCSIYNNVSFGGYSSVSGSIIDNGATIGTGCSIENDTVIGPRAFLKDRTVVHSGTRIWPEVVVEEGQIVKEHMLNEAYDQKYYDS